jgi:hypothetical protein
MKNLWSRFVKALNAFAGFLREEVNNGAANHEETIVAIIE